MSGRWDEPGVPHRGWRCVGYLALDFDEPRAVCEMCCVREIRYVHEMQHDDYPVMLYVGCHCAEHMEGDYVRPRARDEAMRSRAGRRRRWPDRAWRVTRSGGLRVRADGFLCVVKEFSGGWRGSYLPEGSNVWRGGSLRHRTSTEAMLALFDHLWPASGVLRFPSR